jgi:transcriptional regulator of acetoin/glycerol metabolism
VGSLFDTTRDLPDGENSGRERSTAALFLMMRRDRPLEGALRIRLDVMDRVVFGRGAERAVLELPPASAASVRVDLADETVSRDHARLAFLGEWTLEDLGSRNRTYVNGRPIERVALADGDLIEAGQSVFMFRRDAGPPGPRTVPASHLRAARRAFDTYVASLQRDLDRLSQLAASRVTVLILGETGTGKELVARALHELSGRSGQFTAINCGALPTHLVAAELFGFRKGAFSGAQEDRPGLVRAADGGTLFLDEVGELPAEAQTALLRVLQEQEVLPIGGTRPVRIDLRIAAATHRDLDELVGRAELREDLLARLSGFTMRLPPLRHRREDLSLLIPALLQRVAPDPAKVRFSRGAALALLAHDWPQNVRELERCLAAATALAVDRPISFNDLTEGVRSMARAEPVALGTQPPLDDDARAQRDELIRLLTQERGNVNAVARALTKDPKQIRRWLERYTIDPNQFRATRRT